MHGVRKLLVAGALGVLFSGVALAGGPIPIFVDASAAGANNGTSWANAFTDLQSALAIATPSNEIWVAAGTYKPTATADRTISFAMKNGVGIYGGFDGTEAQRGQRDPAVNVT